MFPKSLFLIFGHFSLHNIIYEYFFLTPLLTSTKEDTFSVSAKKSFLKKIAYKIFFFLIISSYVYRSHIENNATILRNLYLKYLHTFSYTYLLLDYFRSPFPIVENHIGTFIDEEIAIVIIFGTISNSSILEII